MRATRVTPDMITQAAGSLDVQTPPTRRRRPALVAAMANAARRAPLVAAAAVVLLSCALAAGSTAYVYQHFASIAGLPIGRSPERVALSSANEAPPAEHRDASTRGVRRIRPRASQAGLDRHLPADAAVTILVSSYPLNEPTAPAEIAALTDWLEGAGFRVFYAEVDLGSRGRWQRVLVACTPIRKPPVATSSD